MKKIKALFLMNRYFFVGCFLFLFISLLFLLTTSKVDGFLYLNTYHFKSLDLFFRIYTNAGDGLVCVGIFLLFLFLKRALEGWEIMIMFLLCGLVAQLIKYFFPMPRPRTLLGDTHYPYFIDGFTHVGNGSYPSGHTTTAFGLATILSLFDGNKKRGLIYLLGALGVAYSRIYLAQHFLQDVFAGAIVGIAGALLVYIVIDNHPAWFMKMKQAQLQQKK